jgi:hypothetical protein
MDTRRPTERNAGDMSDPPPQQKAGEKCGLAALGVVPLISGHPAARGSDCSMGAFLQTKDSRRVISPIEKRKHLSFLLWKLSRKSTIPDLA